MGNDKQQIPNYIYCSITGQRFAVRRDVMLQRIKEAGSLERLQKTYVCRDARRLMTKEGKSLEEVRKILGCDPEHANMDLVDSVAKGSSSLKHTRVSYENQEIDTFWRAWKVDPNWDKRPMDPDQIAEATKEACLMPNRKLDKDCEHCRYFTMCKHPGKGVYKR